MIFLAMNTHDGRGVRSFQKANKVRGSNYGMLFNAQQLIREGCKEVSLEIRLLLIEKRKLVESA